jgi:hypothetical protein
MHDALLHLEALCKYFLKNQGWYLLGEGDIVDLILRAIAAVVATRPLKANLAFLDELREQRHGLAGAVFAMQLVSTELMMNFKLPTRRPVFSHGASSRR